MTWLGELVTNLQGLGFYDFLLPWLLTFAIVYGLLVKSNLFGNKTNKVSGIIAIVAAFFITPYAGPAISGYFSTLFSGASVILSGVLVIVLLVAMAGFKLEDAGGNVKKGIVILLAIIGIILVIIASGGTYYGLTIGANISAAAIFMIVVVVLAVILVVMGKSDETNSSTKSDNE